MNADELSRDCAHTAIALIVQSRGLVLSETEYQALCDLVAGSLLVEFGGAVPGRRFVIYRDGACSVKTRNLGMNLRRLSTAIGKAILAILPSIQYPVLVPVSFLVAYVSLEQGKRVDLAPLVVEVFGCMWNLADDENVCSTEKIADELEDCLTGQGVKVPGETRLKECIEELVRIEAIRETDGGGYQLLEEYACGTPPWY